MLLSCPLFSLSCFFSFVDPLSFFISVFCDEKQKYIFHCFSSFCLSFCIICSSEKTKNKTESILFYLSLLRLTLCVLSGAQQTYHKTGLLRGCGLRPDHGSERYVFALSLSLLSSFSVSVVLLSLSFFLSLSPSSFSLYCQTRAGHKDVRFPPLIPRSRNLS